MLNTGSGTVYPYILYAQNGAEVYPMRHTRREPTPLVAQLAQTLRGMLNTSGLEIITDACFKFVDGGYTYPASLVVYGGGFPALALDVEIDEPYSVTDFAPRHYIEDSSDTHRDHLMNTAGWNVVRIAEKQVADSVERCAAYILAIAQSLVTQEGISSLKLASVMPARFRKLSRVRTEGAARVGFREGYLSPWKLADFAVTPYADPSPLTAEEKACTAVAESFAKASEFRDDAVDYNERNRFERDADISFIPETHTYLYRGCDCLKSVTTVISELFPAFDSYGMAEVKARKEGVSPNVFLDQWALASREAAETGTHMHAQIENFFLGRKTNSSYHLRFESPTVKCDKYVDVAKELEYFNDFISRAGIKPYRTEWPVFDIDARIAGSPDLVAEKDGKLMMFDWKRSTKVVNAFESRGINARPNLSCWNRYGFGPYSALPDCSFVHYSLQQAVYKRILRKNYGVNLARTFLVVLHPSYPHFYIIETMDVEKYVDMIFSSVH